MHNGTQLDKNYTGIQWLYFNAQKSENAVMFVWFLIFQHASISFFPEEPQTQSQTTLSLGLWKSLSVWFHVF